MTLKHAKQANTMRIIIILFLFCLINGCNKNNNDIHPLPTFTDRWEVRGGKYADRPIFLKINRGLDSIAEHAPLAWQAAASVVLKYPQKSGLADNEEEEALEKIEKMLTYRLSTAGIAVYALKVESDNRCDFIFYTDNKNAVEKVFKSVKKLITDYQIDFSLKRDDKWISYKWFSSWE